MRSNYRIQKCLKKVGEPFFIGTNFLEMPADKNYIVDRLSSKKYVINGYDLGNTLIYRLTKTWEKDVFLVHLMLLYPREVDLGNF